MTSRPTPQPRVNLADRIASEILATIVADRSPGDKLPTFGQMASEYSASQPVIREAVARLEARGVTEVRHGDGIYVRAPDMADISEALRLLVHFATGDARTLFLDMMEFRRFIESEATRLAAARATPEDLAAISGAFERGRAAHAADNILDVHTADLEFHSAIVNASHNSLFALMNSVVQPLMEELRQMYPDRRAQSASSDHQAILKAIVDHEQGRAAELASEHVEHVNQEFSRLLFDV